MFQEIIMQFLIIYIVLIVAAAIIEKKKSKGVKIDLGYLQPSRCRDFGLTLRFHPFNNNRVRTGRSGILPDIFKQTGTHWSLLYLLHNSEPIEG
jgi:hypothetical protein